MKSRMVINGGDRNAILSIIYDFQVNGDAARHHGPQRALNKEDRSRVRLASQIKRRTRDDASEHAIILYVG